MALRDSNFLLVHHIAPRRILHYCQVMRHGEFAARKLFRVFLLLIYTILRASSQIVVKLHALIGWLVHSDEESSGLYDYSFALFLH